MLISYVLSGDFLQPVVNISSVIVSVTSVPFRQEVLDLCSILDLKLRVMSLQSFHLMMNCLTILIMKQNEL